MVTLIRPYRLFNRVEEKGRNRIVSVRIPDRLDPSINDRSISTLETFCLLALLKITKANAIFEFGTCLGATALNLALNTAGLVTTLDLLPDEMRESEELQPWQGSATNGIAVRNCYREWRGIVSNVTQLYGDSAQIDLSRHYGKFDLVWIDGGHCYEVVSSDTRNALKMLKDCGAIAWHDYTEPITPGVTQCVDELDLNIYHVEETKVAFYLKPCYSL